MAGITQWSIWSVSSNNRNNKKSGRDWDSTPNNNNRKGNNDNQLLLTSSSKNEEGKDKCNVHDHDVAIAHNNGATLTITPTSTTPSAGLTISGPWVSHSSHRLTLREEKNNSLELGFFRESGLSPGRPTYHSSSPAVNRPTTSSSDHLSSPSLGDPINLHRSKSANDLFLLPPPSQCLPPIPPRLWRSRQQHACKHADTFTAGQVAALSDNQHHIHHRIHPTNHDHTDHNVNSPAVAVAHTDPDPAPGLALNLSRKKISPPNPERVTTTPLPCHETTADSSSSSSLTLPKPTPSLFEPEASSLSKVDNLSSSSPTHVSPVDEDFIKLPSLFSVFSVVKLQEQLEQHSELRAIFCDASSSLSPSSEVVNVNFLTERSWCAAESEADPHTCPPPHRFPPPLPSPVLPSPSSITSDSKREDPSTLVPPKVLTLEDFLSDPAMPKLRSSDSGASSRTRPDLPRPISTGGSGVSKAPSSPHSISRMFSTKIRGLLHTRDRRASSPLSPVSTTPISNESQANSPKQVSASVPSSPRTAHPPVNTALVHPGQMVVGPIAAEDPENYGTIPISNPFPQKDYQPSVGEPPSGHSSYISMDSPTTGTESTSRDSSTSTESTGIPSNRSSFRSFQDERKRSESPSSPITPNEDYRFAPTVQDKSDTMDTMDTTDYSFEDAQDDARSQEVLVYLDESSEVQGPMIPSVQVEAPTPTVNKHNSHFSITPSRIPRPVSRSRSASPAARRAPSFVNSIREECTGRETPSFLAPRPAPIPIPASGSAKPARLSEGGPKLLRSSTMSSRSSTANSSRAPLSLTPRVRSNSVARPSTANRPGTSFSAMSMASMASNRSMHSPKSPGIPIEGLLEVDETFSLSPPKSPCASTFNPDNAASISPSRGKSGSFLSASIPHEIAIPPPFDARSFRTAPGSPTAPSEYSFSVGLSPKRIPDDMQMCPIVFHTEGSDADVSIPVFLPLPSPVMEPRRSRTVSLRHAFTRLNSHVSKRGTNAHITPDIISRPSSAVKNGAHPLSAEVPQTIMEYENFENLPTTRPRATSGTLPSSSSSSFSRWKSGHTRSSSNPSNLPPPVPPIPAVPTLTGVQAVALTDEERSEIARMPGTIFLKTAIARTGDEADGKLTIQEHRLKPRKGMQGSGAAGKCRFCRRGPFPNMWVCLDSCGFVMCRVCANESVQNGEAELF